MHDKSVLWIGCRDRAEFASIADSIERQARVKYGIELPDPGDIPVGGLVVLAHRHPGEFDERVVEELRGRHPQTRFVCLFGEWCSGSKRLSIAHSVSKVYVHELQGRTEILSRLEDRASVIGNAGIGSSGLVAIYTKSKCFRIALADAFRLLPLKTVQLRFGDGVGCDGVDFVVWEAKLDGERHVDELRELRERHPDAQVIALLTYPREFEVRRLREVGVETISQPFALNDLFSLIRSVGDIAVRSAA